MAPSAEVRELSNHSSGGPRNIILVNSNIYGESNHPHTSNHTKPPSQLSVGTKVGDKRGSMEQAPSGFQQRAMFGSRLESMRAGQGGHLSAQVIPTKQHLRRGSTARTEDSLSAFGQQYNRPETTQHQSRQDGRHIGKPDSGSSAKQSLGLGKQASAAVRPVSAKKTGGKSSAGSISTAKARGKDASQPQTGQSRNKGSLGNHRDGKSASARDIVSPKVV